MQSREGAKKLYIIFRYLIILNKGFQFLRNEFLNITFIAQALSLNPFAKPLAFSYLLRSGSQGKHLPVNQHQGLSLLCQSWQVRG
jgi:hypothetical protein